MPKWSSLGQEISGEWGLRGMGMAVMMPPPHPFGHVWLYMLPGFQSMQAFCAGGYRAWDIWYGLGRVVHTAGSDAPSASSQSAAWGALPSCSAISSPHTAALSTKACWEPQPGPGCSHPHLNNFIHPLPWCPHFFLLKGVKAGAWVPIDVGFLPFWPSRSCISPFISDLVCKGRLWRCSSLWSCDFSILSLRGEPDLLRTHCWCHLCPVTERAGAFQRAPQV